MTTSIPAPDVNNVRFSPARAQEFGYLRIANTVLLLVVTLALIGGAVIGWQVLKLRKTIAEFKPYIVRVNDVGKAEVVFLKDLNYQPKAPEIVRALTDFTTDFFSRMKGRKEAYWHSKYLLSSDLMQRSYLEDQQSKWILKVEQGSGLQNDVTVNRVTLASLTPTGGVAYIDFTRSYYENGFTASRKETDTVTYYFTFAKKIEGQMLRWDPLGILITDMPVQENFSK